MPLAEPRGTLLCDVAERFAVSRVFAAMVYRRVKNLF
jgi:hypothetical protein